MDGQEHNQLAADENKEQENAALEELVEPSAINEEQAQPLSSGDSGEISPGSPKGTAKTEPSAFITLVYKLLNYIYRYFYFVGIQLLRSTRTKRRHLVRVFENFYQTLLHRRKKRKKRYINFFRGRYRALVTPIKKLSKSYADYLKEIKNAKKYGGYDRMVKVCGRMFLDGLKVLAKGFVFLLNYAAPVAGIVLVVFAVQYFNHLPLALKVEYDGKELGYITDESVFQEAEAAMKGRIIEGAQVVDVSEIVETGPQEQENGEDSQEEDTAQQDDNASSQDQQEEESGMEEEPVQEESLVEDEPVLEESVSEEQKPYKAKDIIPRFTLSVLKPYEQVMSADRLTNELIKASGNELEEGDGLYINGKLVGAVTDSTALLTELDNMLQQYEQQASTPQEEEEPAQEDAEEQEQADVVTIGEPKVQFVKKVELESGLYPVSSIRTVDQIMFTLKGEERGEKIYTVVSGDTPLRIAAKNGITLDELKTLNPGVELSLFPGDELLISQSVPYMGVQTTKTIKYQEEMPYQIEQQTDPNQNIGWTAVLQEGSTGIREVTAQVRMIDGVEVERTEVDKQIIQQPVSRILAVGGNQPLQFLPSSSDGGTPSGAFIWPADGGYISCAFMGYAGHTGMDIAGYAGMPLRASADGVVVVSKYSAGYGYHIIIDHGAGVQTLYGHCSALYKQVGETVSQGELIAAMGRTGWATGNHVHFEVRINGQYKNPANYLFS